MAAVTVAHRLLDWPPVAPVRTVSPDLIRIECMEDAPSTVGPVPCVFKGGRTALPASGEGEMKW